MKRGPNWNRGPKVFYVAWSWAHAVTATSRSSACTAIGGWLKSMGFPAFKFSSRSRGQQLFVYGLQGSRRRRFVDPFESGRAIASFVVASLGPEQHQGPIRSGLRTGRRDAARNVTPARASA